MCAREGQRNAKSNTSSSGVSVTNKVQLKSTDKSSVSSKVNQESNETSELNAFVLVASCFNVTSAVKLLITAMTFFANFRPIRLKSCSA